MKLDVETVENAFLPAREITDPRRFAGRTALIEQAYLGLVSQGTNLAILGNRGVGKSSLARQLIHIATGKTELLKRHGIPHGRQLDFLTLYYTCGNSITGTDHLLERLLTSADCLSPWVYDIPAAKRILNAYTPKFEARPFGVGVALSGRSIRLARAHLPTPCQCSRMWSRTSLKRSQLPMEFLSSSMSSIRCAISQALPHS